MLVATFREQIDGLSLRVEGPNHHARLTVELQAMRAEETVGVSMPRLQDGATLVFAAAYDFAWFGVVPAPLSLFGALQIVVGAATLAIRERRARV